VFKHKNPRGSLTTLEISQLLGCERVQLRLMSLACAGMTLNVSRFEFFFLKMRFPPPSLGLGAWLSGAGLLHRAEEQIEVVSGLESLGKLASRLAFSGLCGTTG